MTDKRTYDETELVCGSRLLIKGEASKNEWVNPFGWWSMENLKQLGFEVRWVNEPIENENV